MTKSYFKNESDSTSCPTGKFDAHSNSTKPIILYTIGLKEESRSTENGTNPKAAPQEDQDDRRIISGSFRQQTTTPPSQQQEDQDDRRIINGSSRQQQQQQQTPSQQQEDAKVQHHLLLNQERVNVTTAVPTTTTTTTTTGEKIQTGRLSPACVRDALPPLEKLYYTRETGAFAPFRGSSEAAGLDLASIYDYVIPPNSGTTIETGLTVQFPVGCYGRIVERSSIFRQQVRVGGGVIDPDYRGPLTILVNNNGTSDFQIKRGDRIAQIICERFTSVVPEERESLPKTARGNKGFGSSGRSVLPEN